MDESTFEHAAHEEMIALEDAFAEVDPDQVEVEVSDGVLRLDLRDGTKIVINCHRAARQIWMAAISTAWHFDPVVGPVVGPAGTTWIASKTGEALRPTLARIVRERTGLSIDL